MKDIIGAGVLEAHPRLSVVAGAQAAQVRYLEVDEESAGQRLDNFLLRCLKGVPKTHIYRIIRSGEVRVNKARAQAQTKVEFGDKVRLPPLREPKRPVAPALSQGDGRGAVSRRTAEDFSKDLSILMEDDAMVAVDKPAGLAVHGGSGINHGLIERLRLARPQSSLLELVHRLDRETSGVLLVAKKRSVLRTLQKQFRERTTGKTYLALVLGDWPARLKVINTPLAKYMIEGAVGDEKRVRTVRTDDPDAMTAVTLVKILRSLPGFTLLQVTIKTGRTHQIRVHLAQAGCPIAGDDKYGDFNANRRLARTVGGIALRRMFLHAWRLEFDHPTSGERVLVEAPLPTDLRDWLSTREGNPAPALAS